MIQIYIEMSQGNFLYNYLKQAKMLFFFTKSVNRRAEQVLSGVVGISGSKGGCGERVWKDEYNANTVYMYM
jgi:hypothetical protein